MMTRHNAREKALQFLYRVDISQGGPEENFTSAEDAAASAANDSLSAQYRDAIVKGVLDNKKEIDRAIEACSDNWSIERMGIVDRNILRIAAYELMYRSDTPSKVVMDEAVELAKAYGAEQSSAFINGVLDKIYKDSLSRGGQTAGLA